MVVIERERDLHYFRSISSPENNNCYIRRIEIVGWGRACNALLTCTRLRVYAFKKNNIYNY